MLEKAKRFSIILIIIIIIGGICFFDFVGFMRFFFNALNISFEVSIVLASVLGLAVGFTLLFFAWRYLRIRAELKKYIGASDKEISKFQSNSSAKSLLTSKSSGTRKKTVTSKK